LVLHPAWFAVPETSPFPRCALTAPFHPYPEQSRGGIFSVALSLFSAFRRRTVGVTHRRDSAVLGLSSSDENRKRSSMHAGEKLYVIFEKPQNIQL